MCTSGTFNNKRGQNLRSRVLIQCAKRIEISKVIKKICILNLQFIETQPMESTKQRGVFDLLPLGMHFAE